MKITAHDKKTVTQDVGTVWDIGFKLSAEPEAADDQHNPVRVYVDRPDGTTCTVVAAVADGVFTASHALDVEGDYVATVVVDQPDGGASHQGGYAATVVAVEDQDGPPIDATQNAAPSATSATTDQPGSGPADAARTA